jgi:hypothetical protein
MSTLERSASTEAPAAGLNPRGDRLRVITAGHVGDMEAQLGASGFDVVAVAETEDALIGALSSDGPDAIVVEADLCSSLEQVRDLAPDALLIVIGDHTPAGALGRIERGVSGTVMAGLLHALVAEGVGAAAVWGLVPAFGPGAGLHIPQGMSGSLLSAKADLVRAYLANAFRNPAELVTVASTVAVVVSSSLLLTLNTARPHDRPTRVPFPAPAVEPAPPHPVFAVSPTTRPTLAHGVASNEGEPGGRRPPKHGKSGEPGRHNAARASHATRPPGVAYGWDHRPPKHADSGHHKGWDSNSVPEDLPPGNNAVPADPPPGEQHRSQDHPPGGKP